MRLHDSCAFFYRDSPRWQLVFFDRVAAVFVRRDCLRPDIIQAARTALPAERFAGVTNPQALAWIAVVYSRISPQELPIVRDIYAHNVRSWYARRERHLRLLDRMIAETSERAAPSLPAPKSGTERFNTMRNTQ